jgi:hypothetical protein
MNQREAIFQRAMVSMRPEAIFEVAKAFEAMADVGRASLLYQRVHTLVDGLPRVAFGAIARGTPITGTNGAVIPPGRYWQDIIGDSAKKEWTDWKKSKPEVRIETTEDDIDGNRWFVIFIVPPTANNFGLKGVFFPTNVLGFPTIAEGVTTSQDTVQRPDDPTSAEVFSDITGGIGKAIGSAAKGASEGLGFSTTKFVMIGLGAIVTLVLLNRIVMPMLPIPHIP